HARCRRRALRRIAAAADCLGPWGPQRDCSRRGRGRAREKLQQAAMLEWRPWRAACDGSLRLANKPQPAGLFEGLDSERAQFVDAIKLDQYGEAPGRSRS